MMWGSYTKRADHGAPRGRLSGSRLALLQGTDAPETLVPHGGELCPEPEACLPPVLLNPPASAALIEWPGHLGRSLPRGDGFPDGAFIGFH